jgi:hypothetical protein
MGAGLTCHGCGASLRREYGPGGARRDGYGWCANLDCWAYDVPQPGADELAAPRAENAALTEAIDDLTGDDTHAVMARKRDRERREEVAALRAALAAREAEVAALREELARARGEARVTQATVTASPTAPVGPVNTAIAPTTGDRIPNLRLD